MRRRIFAVALSLGVGSSGAISSPVHAGASACDKIRCSATASVHFTIVIPPTIRLRLGTNPARSMSASRRKGTAQNTEGLIFNANTRQTVSYSRDDRQVTVSLP